MLARFKIPIGYGEILKRTVNEAWADDVLNLAAQQAYYFFFALFPALLALISIASFFPLGNLAVEVERALHGVGAPREMVDLVTGQMREISKDNAGGLLTIAFLFALWSSSGAVVSMCSTLNAAYDITEGRPWWKVRLVALGLTVGLAIFILASMTLVVAGPAIAQKIAESAGLGPVFVWTWNILRWPVIFLLVATAIALVYYFAPDAKQDWVWITPGSVLATVLWVVVSYGLSLYVSNFGSYTETYGVIGGVMVLMLWFYASGIAILMGAELNAEIEHASPYGKDVGEKVPGEKKAIGGMAEREYEEKRQRGEISPRAFPEGVNCDLEHAPAEREKNGGLRPSEAILGAAILLPAALKVAKGVKDTVGDARKEDDPRKDPAAA